MSAFCRLPRVDAGYDVAGYRKVGPASGTPGDFGTPLDTAHGLGLPVLIDPVPNHTPDQHTWFRQALALPPSSPRRARDLSNDGKGPESGVPGHAGRL